MKNHVNLAIFGKVQGVFFRVQAKECADRLGIMGFARNEKNGSVYIEAEGTEQDLQLFIAWCREGPDAARVDHISVAEGTMKGYTEFTIY